MAVQERPQDVPSKGQIAPGAEAGAMGQDTPYAGWRRSDHVGYSLNDSFWLGIQWGRE